ncbi:MAG: hypothetical protein LBV07_00895 [Syntrophobacterales bacterium]|nr:hypothetical protein [Syntrophobacterales bacterium]
MNMVLLDDTLLIARGLHRGCYRHPLMPDKCVKVHLKEEYNQETIREIKYYRRIADKVFPEPIISQYYGTVQTNLGTGYIFDLIKDYNGEVSKTLLHYLSDKSMYLRYKDDLKRAYGRVKTLANQYAIVTMGLKPYNILYRLKNQDNGELIIVDNLGCSNLIPLAYYFDYFARQKLSRRFNQFEKALQDELNAVIT